MSERMDPEILIFPLKGAPRVQDLSGSTNSAIGCRLDQWKKTVQRFFNVRRRHLGVSTDNLGNMKAFPLIEATSMAVSIPLR